MKIDSFKGALVSGGNSPMARQEELIAGQKKKSLLRDFYPP